MRKYIYIIISLFLVASCENEIPFDIKENPPKLVVNALFDASKEYNNISLAMTGRETPSLVDDATVNVYVNGELKDCLTEPVEETDQYGTRRIMYKTDAKFVPDDVVKIEAKTHDGKHSAWSETVVPHSVEIEKVDTAMVSRNSWWNNTDKFFRVKTTFTDDKTKTNYYRIAMYLDVEIEAKSNVTFNDTIIYRTFGESLYVNEDVVLTDGQPIADEEDSGVVSPVTNIHGVFDDTRINGTYTMTASLRVPYSSLPYIVLSYGSGGYGDYLNYSKIGLKVRLKLYSITKTQYYYLKALNIYDSVDYDDFLNMPIKFPSNIEGGTGIFGIGVGNEVLFPLDDYIRPGHY